VQASQQAESYHVHKGLPFLELIVRWNKLEYQTGLHEKRTESSNLSNIGMNNTVTLISKGLNKSSIHYIKKKKAKLSL
jgi:hypothetical protein